MPGIRWCNLRKIYLRENFKSTFCPPPKKKPFNRDGKPFFQTVCSCHVTYAFQSESTLYSYLNVKELLAQSRHEIWSLSDCNWNWTQNHLVLKRTFNHLAKLALWIDWPNGLGFTLKCVCDMTRTYSQMHCTDKYSEHSSIIWPVWPNGRVFI